MMRRQIWRHSATACHPRRVVERLAPETPVLLASRERLALIGRGGSDRDERAVGRCDVRALRATGLTDRVRNRGLRWRRPPRNRGCQTAPDNVPRAITLPQPSARDCVCIRLLDRSRRRRRTTSAFARTTPATTSTAARRPPVLLLRRRGSHERVTSALGTGGPEAGASGAW